MNILYVANEWDYGDPTAGRSFEHYNFYDSLRQMGHRIIYFDYFQNSRRQGNEAMNRDLEQLVKDERPDLLFACFMYDEVSRETMRRISDSGLTTTLHWFCDDHWRWDSFSCQWAPCFNWIVTTASEAPAKYASIGYTNVIKSQWGANPILYERDRDWEHSVTFVGRSHGDRHLYLNALRDAGINVQVWGPNHGNGRLTQEDMIRVFGSSKINLNFAEAAQPGCRQIKGRNFEVPSCGGFLLTNVADNLGDYFELGKEIGVFEGLGDLVDKVRYYLAHSSERMAIARRGYERCLRDHTYERRFNEIFQRIGLCER